MATENYDEGVKRSWDRKGKTIPDNYSFYWGMLRGDQLVIRQVYMMREGRHSLHNLIRGAHNLPNRY